MRSAFFDQPELIFTSACSKYDWSSSWGIRVNPGVFGTVPGTDGIDQRKGTSSALKISPQGKACFVNINDTENRP